MEAVFHTRSEEIKSKNANRKRLGRLFAGLYADSAWLTVTGVLMLADILLNLVGLILDPTVITGAPAWLKPLKFGISTILFSFTVAYMIGRLRKTRRFASVLGRTLAVALVLEIALIDMQAARHTSSHFNTATNFDRSVFAGMGMIITVLFLSTAFLFLATCLEHFTDRAQGWAIRLGLLMALAAMCVGSLMTLPTPEQLAAERANSTGVASLTRIGGHTVGASDGGASMPVIGWSADHGDLRISHFLGLHAMQALLLAWWLVRGRVGWTQGRQTRLVVGIAAICAAAFGEVLWQALRGQSLLRPDAQTLAGWVVWAAATTAFLIWTLYAGNAGSTGPADALKMEANRG